MTDNLFLKTIKGHKQNRTPVWIMRQAGRHLAEYREVRATQKDFISFCLCPEQASAVTLSQFLDIDLMRPLYFRHSYGAMGFRTKCPSKSNVAA